ncbi:MAG: hypothetical protein ABIP75_18045 [Pyrinomonadaceae bacterium]
MLIKLNFAIILLLLCTAFATAQDFAPEVQRAEMKKMELMIGRWEGAGWIQRGPVRESFHGSETIQRKLDGLAVLVEGKFFGDVKPGEAEKVIHETLAVVSFDPIEKGYKFRTYLATGSSGSFDGKLIEGGWQWGFEFAGGQVRYTIKFTTETWFEIGEFSKDGKTWMKNFEMTLKRK